MFFFFKGLPIWQWLMQSRTPNSQAKGTPRGFISHCTATKHRDTKTLHTFTSDTHTLYVSCKSSQLPSAQSWETEKQWTSVALTEINTTIYREKEKRVCAYKKDHGFWGGWIFTDRKREEAGVNVKVDHHSLLFYCSPHFWVDISTS